MPRAPKQTVASLPEQSIKTSSRSSHDNTPPLYTPQVSQVETRLFFVFVFAILLSTTLLYGFEAHVEEPR